MDLRVSLQSAALPLVGGSQPRPPARFPVPPTPRPAMKAALLCLLLAAAASVTGVAATQTFAISIGDTVSNGKINTTEAPGAGNIEQPGTFDSWIG